MYIDQSIKKLDFFNIIKEMPKGVLLHAHFPAVVNMFKFIKYLEQYHNIEFRNIYYVSDTKSIIKYKEKMKEIEKNIYEKLDKLYLSNGNFDEIQENIINLRIIKSSYDFNIPHTIENNFIYGLSYFSEGPPCDGWTKLFDKMKKKKIFQK